MDTPIQSLDAGSDEHLFTFMNPGRYGYFCSQHGDDGGQGMAGLIEVIP